MEANTRVLIVIDDTGPTAVIAEAIVAALAELAVRDVALVAAADFSGTDVLPAGLCFFGCAAPHPPSFAPLAEVLGHINLAGRRCGLFSPGSGEAVAYLAGMVRDSEIAVYPRSLTGSSPGGEEIRAWVRDVCDTPPGRDAPNAAQEVH